MPTNTKIDFIGILLQIGQIAELKQKGKIKLNIYLGDQNLNEIACTIWSQTIIRQVEKSIIKLDWRFSKNEPCILAVKFARTCDYNDSRSLNIGDDARVFVNPELPEAHLLADWIQTIEPKFLKFQNTATLKQQYNSLNNPEFDALMTTE